jgi:DNA primase large subunit
MKTKKNKKDYGMCIMSPGKKCTNCIEHPKPFSENPYDLTNELKMGVGFRLIKGFNLLNDND